MINASNRASLEEVRAMIRSGARVSVGGSVLARGSQKADTSEPRENKYGAIKTKLDGHVFDSLGECNRYRFLKMLVQGGVISDLELQPEYVLGIRDGNGDIIPARIRRKDGNRGAPIRMRGDFRYKINKTGETVVEDFKGNDNPQSRVKRAWVELLYDVRIRIVTNARAEVGSDKTEEPHPRKKPKRQKQKATRAQAQDQ